ncbi:gas vesicle protein [Saccharopolyspora sp. NFXS83]|uniref:gas vesicle protein n=1 Tax=Saccharopolyspora sp. NFXS83 TaxID=2993560 RepID=UPI00224ADE1E|nr:gas vesicle protein [Saccharopolyspora sp. NFXS83]MCX2730492.1 gas vesicle protein [Saccharopolyspora sp. NFXS83]
MAHARDDAPVRDAQEVALVDLLDRLLAGGVVLTGDITISLAGVDLVRVSLRALITSIYEGAAGTELEVGDG